MDEFLTLGGGPHEAVGRVESSYRSSLGLMYDGVTAQCNHMRELKPLNEELYMSNLLTGAFLAGVCKVIVAGYVTPASIIMPHHHYTVFTRQEIAVWLPSVPVLIQLYARREETWVNLFLTRTWRSKLHPN